MPEAVAKKILSVALALLIGYCIGHLAFHREIPHGPDSNDIKSEIYHDHSIGCYRMSPIAHICPFHSKN